MRWLGITCCLASVPVLLFSGGCAPEAYRRSADLQVQSILRDRERQTLDYVPQVKVAEVDVPVTPPPQAYAKVPTTTMPSEGQSPIEPAPRDLPLRPQGPEMIAPSGTSGPPIDAQQQGANALGAEAAQQLDQQRLLLGPPAPHELPTQLDLFGSLQYAVNHSRAYQDRMDELYLTALDVTLQRHLFEPRPFVQQDFDATFTSEDSNYRSALTAATTVGVRQQLPYGGQVVARALVDFVDALNGQAAEGESAQLVLQGSIPLLRGAGLVNLEPLISSERELVYQVRDFEDFRRSFAVDIASTYFSLLSLQQQVKNRQTQFANLSDLTERVQALYAAGKTTFLEVQRALQEKLQSENELINSQAAYQGAVDQFKLRIGMPIEQELQIAPVELELRMPEIDRNEVIETATKYRLDLQTARDQIEDAQRRVQVAKNALLPDVNLTAEGRLRNSEGGPARALNDQTLTYAAGVSIDLPVDRLSERNAYRAALIQLQQAQRNYEQARDQVLADVASAVRRIRAAEITLQIQARGIDLARRRLEFSNELLRQGDVTARDVVESQESLLDAQDSYERAKAALQIELLNFLRDTGMLRVDPQAGSIGHALGRTFSTVGQRGGSPNVQ